MRTKQEQVSKLLLQIEEIKGLMDQNIYGAKSGIDSREFGHAKACLENLISLEELFNDLCGEIKQLNQDIEDESKEDL